MSESSTASLTKIPTEHYEKLSSEVHHMTWSFLQPHAQRGALFWVDSTLDLVQVAWAISQDHLSLVETWLTEGLVQKASDKPLADALAYRFIIVQPYVLASPWQLEVPPAPQDIH